MESKQARNVVSHPLEEGSGNQLGAVVENIPGGWPGVFTSKVRG